MKRMLLVYNPDYEDLCKFKNEFEKFETDISLLRGTIFQWLKNKNDEEIKDIEIKLLVEIEEINKIGLTTAILPLLTFSLGMFGKMYESVGMIYAFTGLVSIESIVLGFGMSRALKYHKYYIFLSKMIDRYNNNR